MSAPGIFGGRRPLRPILGTQATAQVMIEVRTEDELRQALTPKDTGTAAALVANTGRRIVIAAPITLKSSIIIDASLPGTVIESHGYVPLTCLVDDVDAITVRAILCTIRGLLFTSKAIDGSVVTDRFRYCVKVEAGGDDVRVEDCHAFDIGGLVFGDTGANAGFVTGCHTAVMSGDNVDCISIDGANWRVHHNILKASGTGVVIRVGANGEKTAIIGNDLNGQEVHTSASLGSNFIVGNTDDGTLTTHATDIVLQTAGGGGGGGTFGQTTATFSGGSDSVTVTVVDAGVSAGSNIVPSIAMGTRDADEMEMAPVVVAVGAVTAGVGFTIIVVSLDGDADGDYLVNYTRD